MQTQEHLIIKFAYACQMLEKLDKDLASAANNRSIQTEDIPSVNFLQDLTCQLDLAVKRILSFYQQATQQVQSKPGITILARAQLIIDVCNEVSKGPHIAKHSAYYFASKYGLGESTLRKHFKDHLRISLHQYVTHECMKKANELKQEQKLNTDEIATTLGYADRSGFIKAFKRYVNQHS